jgi:competence protein ComEC
MLQWQRSTFAWFIVGDRKFSSRKGTLPMTLVGRNSALKALIAVVLILTVTALACAVPTPPPGLASPTVTTPPTAPTSGELLKVLFLDIGQGDATLIRSPGGRTMLIDGGNGASDADNVILPALQAWGSDRLDVMVITHPDQDHIGGLPRVVEAVPVGRVVLTGQVHTTQTYERLLTAIRDKKLPAVRARGGMSLDFDPSVTTAILGPTDALVESDDTNNASIVIRMAYGAVTFLFIGDAEETEEAVILNSGADVHAQILKVGHHGSRSSTSPDWLQAVSPQVGIISVGENNHYGHPHPEVLDWLSQFGVRVYRTDQHGTITIVTDGTTYEVSTER